jgi:hypothetical protein
MSSNNGLQKIIQVPRLDCSLYYYKWWIETLKIPCRCVGFFIEQQAIWDNMQMFVVLYQLVDKNLEVSRYVKY